MATKSLHQMDQGGRRSSSPAFMLRRYRKTLLSLFLDLQSLKSNPDDVLLCFSIQERLLTCVRRTEYRARAVKEQARAIGRMIKNGRLPREDVLKLREALAYSYSKKTAYHQLLSILRDIGDGIVFSYFSKWDIKPLCLSKEHAGFISGKRGLRTELKYFRYCKAQGIVCVLNDITNSIRHGDITVFKDGQTRIVEVKSNQLAKNDARGHRQIERGRRILKYLTQDLGDNVYPGQGATTLHRKELINEESHHRETATNLLVEALASRRTITRKIEDGLYYNIGTSVETNVESLNCIPSTKGIVCFFVNAEKYIKQAYYPFTLSISKPEALFEFYDGRCLITVFIDIGIIEESLAKHGIRLCLNVDGDNDFLRLQHLHTGLSMHVSKHFFGRVAVEFLSLQWMIQELAGAVGRALKDFTEPSAASLQNGT